MPVAGSLFQPGSTIIHRLNPQPSDSGAVVRPFEPRFEFSVDTTRLVFTSIILLALAKALRQAG
jgi:hypothetical protein